MTPESMEHFLDSEKSKGASANMLRRFKGAIQSVYNFLPDDKHLTKERLCAWRENMEARNYASATIQNYVKHINRYLDCIGYSDIRFNRGKSKDIAGMTFGFLTAIQPTEKRDRKDIVWRCQCQCGTVLELPATRLLRNNTLSCGCINREHLKRANKYIAQTGLRQALDDRIHSTRNQSGYIGVVKKRNKWQAQITYRRKNYCLGTFSRLEDAVNARARAKERVMEDAEKLLELYDELHKDELTLPNRCTEPPKEPTKSCTSAPPAIAMRCDNTSGYTGVTFRKNKWEARICHQGIRYTLGRFETKEAAIRARQKAEELLREDPLAFVAHDRGEQ